MKRLSTIPRLFLATALVASLALGARAAEPQKTVSLNYSNLFPANHKISVVAEEWCKEIEKRTNGAVKITMFHGGTLTPATQTYDGVVKGLSDVGMSVFSYHRGRFPLTEFSDLPLGMRSSVTSSRLFNEYYQKFRPKELDDVVVMYLHGNPPAILHTVKKPVATIDDLKGLKLRVTPLGSPIVKHLGAAPVAMPMGDTYDALSKNVVDGGFIPYEALEGWKLGEVVNNTTECWPVGFTSAFYVVMNKQKWDSISRENQKVIEKINTEWIERTGKAWDEIDASGKAFFTKRGGKVITLSKAEGDRWTKAVEPVLEDYVRMTKEKGLPGDQVLKFAQEYLRKNQK